MHRFLSTFEAADRLGVSFRTLDSFIREQRLVRPSGRTGGRRLLSERDFEVLRVVVELKQLGLRANEVRPVARVLQDAEGGVCGLRVWSSGGDAQLLRDDQAPPTHAVGVLVDVGELLNEKTNEETTARDRRAV